MRRDTTRIARRDSLLGAYDMPVAAIKRRLKEYSDRKKIPVLMSFFKTGPGEYGEGDIFIGTSVPLIRKAAREYSNIKLEEISGLLKSPVHEERLAAIFILVSRFRNSDADGKKEIYEFYLGHSAFVNNWDLVDSSAHHIIGGFLADRDKKPLYRLASSVDLWKKRMSIIATFHYIKNGRIKESLKISKMLLKDKEDLIHKAVGWMLREVGKKDLRALEDFLSAHYMNIPRTTLRYAIEKMPESKRRHYLNRKKITN